MEMTKNAVDQIVQTTIMCITCIVTGELQKIEQD